MVIIGAIIGLAGLFLSWTEITATGIFTGITISDKMTGFEGLTDDAAYEPMMVLLGAVIAIIIGLLLIMGKKDSFGEDGIIAKVVLILMSIVILVGSVKVLLDINDASSFIPPEAVGLVNVSASAGIGLYMAVVAGIIILVATILSIAKVLPEEE